MPKQRRRMHAAPQEVLFMAAFEPLPRHHSFGTAHYPMPTRLDLLHFAHFRPSTLEHICAHVCQELSSAEAFSVLLADESHGAGVDIVAGFEEVQSLRSVLAAIAINADPSVTCRNLELPPIVATGRPADLSPRLAVADFYAVGLFTKGWRQLTHQPVALSQQTKPACIA
jgi:hypothetical protein